MAAPAFVKFDRYAQLSFGLIAEGFVPAVAPNGIALVTRWLSGSVWNGCSDPATIVWTNCYSVTPTVWSACYTPVTTTWVAC